MAEEKKTSPGKGKQNTQNTGRKSNARNDYKEEPVREEPKTSDKKLGGKKKREPNPSSAGNQLVAIILIVLALFIAICYAFGGSAGVVGIVGGAIRDGLFGIFGIAAFLVPFLLVQIAVFWKRDVANGAVAYKFITALFSTVFLAVIVHAVWRVIGGALDVTKDELHLFTLTFREGISLHGGGFVGGTLAMLLIYALGYSGTIIFSLLFFFGFGMAQFGLTPSECVARYRFYHHRNQAIRKARKEQAQMSRAEREEQRRRQAAEAAAARRTDITVRDHKGKIDSDIFNDDFGKTENDEHSEVLYPVSEIKTDAPTMDTTDLDLTKIFDKNEDEAVFTRFADKEKKEEDEEDLSADVPKNNAQLELKVTKKPVVAKKIVPPVAPASASVPVAPPPPPKPTYIFPPIALLQTPPAQKGTDVSAELRENADRITQTLDSFNVHVTIANVSRGPTVTRYELEPAAGTRVRSILNLLDDIALSLATNGVRSDGVIAGKSAIGIEVPNKTLNTVYVRELIDLKKFEESKSRLTTTLGMDVSGAPVYLDIAKMPHLLIAGATGMGKSVCINSLLISLLYKARPDEVKLILIDPKKVELNIYNGIPHLLVPVVFDPKKAAGSLHWAVTEMERRFELIEGQNARNIEQYNAAVKNDSTKEQLPQVVIIIDELADLMMTAPDDVEASVCRLAQKARAAGMHLILGTQRPSVDVITGLIKANIPSRIAFRSSSQIDSRTILDQQGAEKLIGRGDMLYAPVGSDKPLRVQGAFVSEKEIEEVVEFIKAHSQACAYSGEVIEQIDKAAELCGQKKRGAASPDDADSADANDDTDPMLDNAIELAVDSGKISTSLIQRRLSLGYGRAAKLIDVMERMGIVSAPDGQKPRTVLLTREQYLERKMNRADSTAEEDGEEDPPFDL